jgi:hypothetical protein
MAEHLDDDDPAANTRCHAANIVQLALVSQSSHRIVIPSQFQLHGGFHALVHLGYVPLLIKPGSDSTLFLACARSYKHNKLSTYGITHKRGSLTFLGRRQSVGRIVVGGGMSWRTTWRSKAVSWAHCRGWYGMSWNSWAHCCGWYGMKE